MLNGVEFDLNSVQFCSDSLKQRIRRTMLKQECVFMSQVSELHRLHRTQVTMMNGFKLRDSDYYKFHSGNSNLSPLKLDNQVKCSMDDSLNSENLKLLHVQVQPRASNCDQRPLDLQLPAEDFIRQSANDILGKRVHEGSLKVSIDTKNSPYNKVASDLNNLDLSLSIGQGTREKCREHRSMMGNRTHASSSTVIHLEDPNFRFSNNAIHLGLTCGFVAAKALSGDQHKLKNFINSDHHDSGSSLKRRINHMSCGTALGRSILDLAPSFESEILHVSGLNKNPGNSSGDFLSNDYSVASSSANKFDLNVAAQDDSSYLSNNPSLMVNPLGTTLSVVSDKVYFKSAVIPSVCPTDKMCSKSAVIPSVNPTSCKESNVNGCRKESEIHVQGVVKSDLAQSSIVNFCEKCSKVGKSGEDNRGKITYIDLDPDSGEELCSSRSDPKIESIGSSSKLSKGISFEIDMVDVVGAAQDLGKDLRSSTLPHSCQNQSAPEQLKRQKLSSSSESECILDQPSNSTKTMQSGVKGRGFNCSSSDDSQMVGVGPAAAHSRELDQRYCDSHESNTGCIFGKECELDAAVQTAAELLLQLSLETEPSYPSDLVKIESNEVHNKECDQPQCSSESYEAMVLKAKESDGDDYSVSSNAVVADEAESKDSRYKLKRGTRMKDFQKDILPGLSTLSRHEIREDMKIIEGIMRSREYKKMKTKVVDEGEWCRSTRKRRSRLRRY